MLADPAHRQQYGSVRVVNPLLAGAIRDSPRAPFRTSHDPVSESLPLRIRGVNGSLPGAGACV
jgi:hypothetical protein